MAKDENKHKWIQSAIKHPGALRAQLHVKEGKKIPLGTLLKASHENGAEGKRARLALAMRHFHPG